MAKKKKQKLSLLNKIFLIILPLALFFGVLVLFFSVRSSAQKETCGCPAAEGKASGEFDPRAKIAYFENKAVKYDFKEILPLSESLALERKAILGVMDDNRWIEIDLSDQRLYAYEGDRVVYDFLVSTGKWNRTPTGTFRVWLKLKYTKMSGGSKENGSYYYLPNVPYVMYFYKGFGTHGTYWHQSFGQPMSHGCINLATPDAEKLFYWASPVLPKGKKIVRATKNNPGTKVIVRD